MLYKFGFFWKNNSVLIKFWRGNEMISVLSIHIQECPKFHFNLLWSWKVAWILSKTFEYLQEIILISTKYLASKNFAKYKVQGFFITFSYNAGIRYIHLHHQDYKIDSITFQMDIGYSLCTFLLTSYQYDSGLNA